MRPLRWTVLATQVPAGGSLGGVVRYTTELIRALAERDDVVVSAITTRAAADTVRELLGGGTVRSVPGAPVPLLSLAERHAPLPGLRHGADVVHGVKHLVPRRTDALRVLTVHDMLLLDRAEDFGVAKRMLLPPSYRASIRSADLLLCVSDATRRRVEAYVAGATDRAAVTHLATSSSLRSADPEPIPALAERRFALVVGDPTPRKNLGTVMAAWNAVRAARPDVVLAIAGPPSWGRTELGPLYAALVNAGAVVPLGHVSDAQLRWAYENTDVVLCPSLAEGFGLPAAEAMAFGAPVVISDDPAMVEVAAGRAAAVLPALAVEQWTQAIIDVVREPQRVAPGQLRTWADVAEDTVAATRVALHRRDRARTT